MKNWNSEQLWNRFKRYYREYPTLGLGLDISRVSFPDDFFESMGPKFERAFRDMAALEGGAIANPDENRMVGHYWLRNPSLAPTHEIREEIEATVRGVKQFAARIHGGRLCGAGGSFKKLLIIGIGGSALGPQFVANALSTPESDKIDPFFFDNTDPEGMDKIIAKLRADLGRTLCIVISKSGGTKETRNGMFEAKAAYMREGLRFEDHAVAVTGQNSDLDKIAMSNRWLARFPMWDWVGGRTSELSAVGLLPAALQGFDIDAMLAGAKACDEVTRRAPLINNPSAVLAAIWYQIGNGKGDKDMVVLPYKDSLELISRYLQQLIMESLGKEHDLAGSVVNQGIAVYGNKGSTDQHAYIQQLRDGVHNFFVTFIEVLKDRSSSNSTEVEAGVTSGDYLQGFLLGTRDALWEKDRQSITITVGTVSPFSVGVLIALFERAVGFYANLININAYNQPGVEAGKKAAGQVLQVQEKVRELLRSSPKVAFTVQEIATAIQCHDAMETIFKVCEHLASNPGRGVEKLPGETPFEAEYRFV